MYHLHDWWFWGGEDVVHVGCVPGRTAATEEVLSAAAARLGDPPRKGLLDDEDSPGAPEERAFGMDGRGTHRPSLVLSEVFAWAEMLGFCLLEELVKKTTQRGLRGHVCSAQML